MAVAAVAWKQRSRDEDPDGPDLRSAYGPRYVDAGPAAAPFASSHESSTTPFTGSARRRISVAPRGPARFGSRAPSRSACPMAGLTSQVWLFEPLATPVGSTMRSRFRVTRAG